MLTINVLTTEQEQLQIQENRIQQGLKTFFWEVGDALRTIRDSKLYRSKHNTFEEYCHSEWNFSDRYARNLIRAAETFANLEAADLLILPTSESQARELAKLPNPEEQIDAWMRAAQAHQKPTAEQVKTAVAQVKAKIDAASQPAVSFAPGCRARVVSGKHQGTEVEVTKTESNGSIVHSAIPGGKSYPFLAGELEVIASPPAKPEQPAQAKLSLKDENQQLKEMLRRVLTEAGAVLTAETIAAARACL